MLLVIKKKGVSERGKRAGMHWCQPSMDDFQNKTKINLPWMGTDPKDGQTPGE